MQAQPAWLESRRPCLTASVRLLPTSCTACVGLCGEPCAPSRDWLLGPLAKCFCVKFVSSEMLVAGAVEFSPPVQKLSLKDSNLTLTVVAELIRTTGVIWLAPRRRSPCLSRSTRTPPASWVEDNVVFWHSDEHHCTTPTLRQRRRGSRSTPRFNLFPFFLATSRLSRGWKLGQQCT